MEESALPEVYQKVVKAQRPAGKRRGFHRLRSGRKADLPRVYYKYRDAVVPLYPKSLLGILTVQVILTDRPGVLVSLLTVFTRAGQTSSR